MDDLLEFLFHLIGKFWPALLAYLAYQAFRTRREGEKRAKGQRPVLTPVHGGGFPRPHVGQREEGERLAPPDTPADASAVEERDATPQEEMLVAVSLAPPTAAASDRTSVEKGEGIHTPREGMKWALIFSPPRAKMPYLPPTLPRRRI
ncbi:hypothetical protein G3578_02885 [Brevibacillus sp. SYP-B805]|uniref:hypothetical protein n=1 Tax=Brevibacillus sp. SYP-B805 TaxID=1578199 RepID=UPI0013EE0AA6|nr:hypothetical protein [Brevibacillus sp. SYP-B805]NGQ94118.1 hypothetical protein [Brevibacillus sp. SYP-B805]